MEKKQLKILIVEDIPGNYYMLANKLKDLETSNVKFKFPEGEEYARSIEEADSLSRAFKPDLIFLDYFLAGRGDADQFISSLPKDGPKIIIVSGSLVRGEKIVEEHDLVIAFVNKPIHRELLKKALDLFLAAWKPQEVMEESNAIEVSETGKYFLVAKKQSKEDHLHLIPLGDVIRIEKWTETKGQESFVQKEIVFFRHSFESKEDGGKTLVRKVTTLEKLPFSRPLVRIEADLPESSFLQVAQNLIVNLNFVTRVWRVRNGDQKNAYVEFSDGYHTPFPYDNFSRVKNHPLMVHN